MRGFLRKAKDLEEGNSIMTLGDKPFTIKSIEKNEDAVTMKLVDMYGNEYNATAKLEDEFETYFIQAMGIENYKP